MTATDRYHFEQFLRRQRKRCGDFLAMRTKRFQERLLDIERREIALTRLGTTYGGRGWTLQANDEQED